MEYRHKNLANGKWQTMTLLEQLGNIGSEVGRARHWQGKNEQLFNGAVSRAYELMNLTIADIRWKKRLKEIIRARETFSDALEGGREYDSSLMKLEKYFAQFAYAARLKK